MNKNYLRLHGATLEEVLNGNKLTLTVRQFLGKDEGSAYFKADLFLTFAKSLREQEVEQLEKVFSAMHEGLRVVGSIVPRTDKGGRRYVFVTLGRANASVGYKYILQDGMATFLDDYMNGKFVVGFTLNELVDEAINS